MSEIDNLIGEVRRCKVCFQNREMQWHKPCIYGSPYSKILVVSWDPSKEAYMGKNTRKRPYGEIMAEVPLDGTMREDEPPFCRECWLNISGDFSPRNFFWIHRANCSVDLGGSHDRCSKMWLEKAINLIMAAGHAELVLAFGGRAARYLLRDRKEKVLDLVNKRDLLLERSGGSLRCIVHFHWSPRNVWRNKEGQYREAHERSLEYAKEVIRKVICMNRNIQKLRFRVCLQRQM